MHVWVAEVERDRLVLVRRWVAVVHQRQVGADPGREPQQLAVPVEPPAWVLLPKHDHEQRTEHEQPTRPGRNFSAVVAGEDAPMATADRPADDEDRDCDDDPERGRQSVELALRVGDRKLRWVCRLACSLARLHRFSLLSTATPWRRRTFRLAA